MKVLSLLKRIKRFIGKLFLRDYYFIVTLREESFKKTPLGQKMIAEGMDSWNTLLKKTEGEDFKPYTEESWKEKLESKEITEFRCIGFYSKKDLAERCISENWGDWNECNYYRYAIIYHIKGEGIYNFTTDQDWYESKFFYEVKDGKITKSRWLCDRCKNKTPNVIYLWS